MQFNHYLIICDVVGIIISATPLILYLKIKGERIEALGAYGCLMCLMIDGLRGIKNE